MTFQNVLDTFFMREDQDAFARSQGWDDAEQMIYYENLAMQEQSKQDALLHELAKVDSREVYTDSEDCPRDGDVEHTNWQDLAGVY